MNRLCLWRAPSSTHTVPLIWCNKQDYCSIIQIFLPKVILPVKAEKQLLLISFISKMGMPLVHQFCEMHSTPSLNNYIIQGHQHKCVEIPNAWHRYRKTWKLCTKGHMRNHISMFAQNAYFHSYFIVVRVLS